MTWISLTTPFLRAACRKQIASDEDGLSSEIDPALQGPGASVYQAMRALENQRSD
jgi:hypothetical protein